MDIRRSTSISAGLLGASLLLAACGGVEPAKDEVFLDTQRKLAEARADDDIGKHAKVPIEDAAATLARAREANDLAELRQLTYLTQKKIEIAHALAAARAAEERAETLEKENEARRLEPYPSPKVESEPLVQSPADGQTATSARDEQALQAAIDAQARIRSLEQSLAEFKTREETRNILLTLGDVSFAPGEASLRPAVRRKLIPLVDYMNANPQRKIVIKGYTDNTGQRSANLALSDERAKAVKAALINKGINAERILTIGYGENDPIADNDTAEGRSANRRVEIVLVDGQPDNTGPATEKAEDTGPRQLAPRRDTPPPGAGEPQSP